MDNYAGVNDLIEKINKYYPHWKVHDDYDYYFVRPLFNEEIPAATLLRDESLDYLNNKIPLCNSHDTVLHEFSNKVKKAEKSVGEWTGEIFGNGGTRKQSKDKMKKQKSKKSRKVKNPKKKSKYSRKAK